MDLSNQNFGNGDNQFTVDLSHVPAGIYFATATSLDGRIAAYTKVIKN